MTTETTTTVDPASTPGAPAAGPVEPPQPATPPATPPAAPAATPAGERTYTEAELNARVAKARKDEKGKVYGDLETARAATQAAKDRVTTLETEQAAAQTELEGVRTGRTSDLDSVNRELTDLRDKNQKLEQTVNAVADTATANILAAELKAYRKEQIAASGITDLADLVTGDTEAEVDASIIAVKARETAIADKAREQARTELGQSVPTPLAPGGGGSDPATGITQTNIKQIASLKGEAWDKKRAELLADAKLKSGMA